MSADRAQDNLARKSLRVNLTPMMGLFRLMINNQKDDLMLSPAEAEYLIRWYPSRDGARQIGATGKRSPRSPAQNPLR